MKLKFETKYIFITIAIDLFIAFLVLLLFTGFEWRQVFAFILGLSLNISINIVGLYFIDYLVGQNLHRLIEKTRPYNILHGILTIFIVLVLGTIIGSTVEFLQDGFSYGYRNNLMNELFDYYIKPLYWICMTGFIPTLINGIILGSKLRTASRI